MAFIPHLPISILFRKCETIVFSGECKYVLIRGKPLEIKLKNCNVLNKLKNYYSKGNNSDMIEVVDLQIRIYN